MRVLQAYRALFSDRKFFRLLLPVAVPIALQNLISSLTALGSGLFVGQLGTDAIAGVSLAGQIQFVMLLAAFGLASGAGIFTSQFWGRRDERGVAHTQGVSLLLNVFVAVLFTAAGLFPEPLLGLFSPDQGVVAEGARYLRTAAWSFPLTAITVSYSLVLRSVGDTRTPLVFALAGLAVQLAAAGALIFGVGPIPGLGTTGAGLALLLAKFVETAGIVTATQLARRPNAGFRRLLSFNAEFFWRFLKVTVPVLANEVLWAIGIVSIKAIYGWMGAAELASAAILDTFSQLVFVVLFGTGNGAAIVIGHAIGRGHRDDAKRFAFNTALLAPLVGVALAIPLAIAAPFLPLIFHVTDEVRSLTTGLIWTFCALLPGRAFYHDMMIGVLRGGGDTGFSLIMDLAGVWLWALPVGWLMAFVFHWPFFVVFFLIGIEEPLKSLLGFWRMKTGRWIKDVARD